MKILSVLIVLIILTGCSSDTEVPVDIVRPIAWEKIDGSNFKQSRVLSGLVAPVETAKLSFEVPGKVKSIFVNLGSKVDEGQELARLNQQNFKLNLQSSKAQYEQAQIAFNDAGNTYKRYSELFENNSVSKADIDRVKALLDNSKSAVDIAKSQLDMAEKNLQDSILLAPYDCIITKRLFEPSQQVAAGQPVLEIEGVHGLEVNVMVPETIIQEISLNTDVTVRFPVLPDVKMIGRITEIGTRAEYANSFPVTVVLKDNSELLRAGMTSEVEFSFNIKSKNEGDFILVPITALLPGLNQKTYVFVYDSETELVHRREVSPVNTVDNKVYISAGLKPGEIIAIAGVAFLEDGQKVSLIDNSVKRFN